MRSRRTKVIPRTARGWTRPRPSGRTFRAFRGRMWFVGVSGGTVKFSEPDPSVRYWIGVDHGAIDYSAETTYTNTVGGLTIGIDPSAAEDSVVNALWHRGDDGVWKILATPTLDGAELGPWPTPTMTVGGISKKEWP